jgi:hypothetical protein
MRLAPIVVKIRAAGTRFGNKVGGAAEMAKVLESPFTKDVAFVVPITESVGVNAYDSGINQKITERFGVVVALDNGTSDREKTGIIAYDELFDIRAEIWEAILGWQVPEAESIISYAGGRLIGLTRATLWYLFEFSYQIRIDDDDGVQTDLGALDDFNTIFAQYKLTEYGEEP